MSEIVLNRFAHDALGTYGHILLWTGFSCFSLEPPVEGKHCCIPAGNYSLGLKKVGTSRFDSGYSRKFAGMHEGMIEILDVPNRSEILIHIGNYPNDTEGCCLMGLSSRIAAAPVREGGLPARWIGESTEAYRKLYPLIRDAIKTAGAKIVIGGLT